MRRFRIGSLSQKPIFSSRFSSWIAAAFLLIASARAETPVHRYVLVFVPAYEGSALYDRDLGAPDEPICVWGNLDALRHKSIYYGIRLPNKLEARPLMNIGPVDIYGRFWEALQDRDSHFPKFEPFTPEKDLFFFSYDWRQEIGMVTAPSLYKALRHYAEVHSFYTQQPPPETHFVIVTHSMGGLVVRTMLSQHPEFASFVDRLILVGSPNLGSVKAIHSILVGPGGLQNAVLPFPAFLVKLLPNDVDDFTTRIASLNRPSLFELLPIPDPQWVRVNAQGHQTRVSPDDILTLGTWRDYLPTAQTEKREYLDPWRKVFKSAAESDTRDADWEFCQNESYLNLQTILAEVRDWRLQMGTLHYTDQLMTAPGDASRLRVVAGTGLKTPTGVICEGDHDSTTARYTYAPDTDGDETVTKASALEDLTNPSQIFLLSNVSHGKLMGCDVFLNYLKNELSELTPAPGLRTTDPIPRAQRVNSENTGTAP